MKIKITKKLENNFEKAKAIYNKDSDAECYEEINNPIIGYLWWKKPNDVLWVYATDNEEDYEGSQTQIGIKRDGTIVWGFFSHCSCYGYEDYEGDYQVFEDKEDTFKQYEMENVDREILKVLKERLKKISVSL